jgi:hypothetical protein
MIITSAQFAQPMGRPFPNQRENASPTAADTPKPTAQTNEGQSTGSQTAATENGKPQQADQAQEIQRLKARDREVRAHEAAHMAAGGSVVKGGAHFQYKRGPDGVLYAVGGEVSIDASVEQTPQATLLKAERIRRAALAPADPSAQDRSVAASASQMAAQARMEMGKQRMATNAEGWASQPKPHAFEGPQSHSSAIRQYQAMGSLASPPQTNVDDYY